MVSFFILNRIIEANENYHLTELVNHGDLAAIRMEIYADLALVAAVLALFIASFLLFVEDFATKGFKASIARVPVAAGAGALFGGVGGVAAQIVFSNLLNSAQSENDYAPVLVIARSLGWGVLGLACGCAPGLAARSMRRAKQGMLGGVIGGIIGGIAFDAIGNALKNDALSRAFGFTVIGLSIGVLVGVVRELKKDAWLTFLGGSREGRSVLLDSDIIMLGRSESADVPLFGDPNVMKEHALIHLDGGLPRIEGLSGATIFLGGCAVTESPLSDSVEFRIGSHRLLFRTRSSQRQLAHQAVRFAGAPAPPTPSLRVISGPLAGCTLKLKAGLVLGRDSSCDLSLPEDPGISRKHARVDFDGRSWILTDLQSSNGTYLNAVRLPTACISAGDKITLGQTNLLVET